MSERKIRVATARGELTLREGVIDDEAEYAYTNGQCIALSLALHKLTDWPIIAQLSRPGDRDWEDRTHGRHIGKREARDGWFYHFVHSLVQTPDGWLIDIRSEHDAEDFRIEASYHYGTCALVSVEPAALQSALADARKHGAVHMEQNVEAATGFAKVLLAEYGKMAPFG